MITTTSPQRIFRGDIYFVAPTQTTGSEMCGGRPAIVVSDNALNTTSTVIQVVYLTTAEKKKSVTHVSIRSSPKPSTALCEQVHSVSKERVGKFYGVCTPLEMQNVDLAVKYGLGLAVPPHIRNN